MQTINQDRTRGPIEPFEIEKLLGLLQKPHVREVRVFNPDVALAQANAIKEKMERRIKARRKMTKRSRRINRKK